MTHNTADYRLLRRALRHVDALTNIDLDAALRLVSGANIEVVGLHLRIIHRMKWLAAMDPDCAALEMAAQVTKTKEAAK